ncbi:MAG: 5'/3'-nucleotidase SurE [Spirochaetaceae bacterium]|jgi:5'-nucleotidase|nr:5'/3'-nucleotidase SurE [Spirochaetaceae bacterium]
MRILITNDDGYEAKGIRILAEVLGRDHDVWIIAPDRNRSAVSHSITFATPESPVRLKPVGEHSFACTGLPVDCTINGIRGIMEPLPDVVISGINEGVNIGTDLLFSGTAAAARQASLYGIPAIAVSADSPSGRWNYEPLAVFVRDNLDILVSLCEPWLFLNINALDVAPYRGCKCTSLSRRFYSDILNIYDGEDGRVLSHFTSGTIESEGDEYADARAVEEGYVSVSRIYAQPAAAGSGGFENLQFHL